MKRPDEYARDLLPGGTAPADIDVDQLRRDVERVLKETDDDARKDERTKVIKKVRDLLDRHATGWWDALERELTYG